MQIDKIFDSTIQALRENVDDTILHNNRLIKEMLAEAYTLGRLEERNEWERSLPGVKKS